MPEPATPAPGWSTAAGGLAAASLPPVCLEPLPEGVTLRVWNLGGGPPGANGSPALLFGHGGRWLHPLFGLRDFLAATPPPPGSRLVLHDRIIGRAAAWLVLDCGIREVVADLASRGAASLLAGQGCVLLAGRTVEAIACQTETLLAATTDRGAALSLLDERRRQALAKPARQPLAEPASPSRPVETA